MFKIIYPKQRMKNFFALFLFVNFFFGVLFAAEAKNPSEPTLLSRGFFIPSSSPVNLRASYEGSYITNARMKQTQEGSGRVDNFEVFSNLGLLVIDIDDRFDLYGGFGTSTIDSNWRFSNSSGGISRVVVESNNRYSWTIGINTTLFCWEQAFIGGGVRYSGAHADLAWATLNGVNLPTSNAEFRWLQWQAGVALGYKIGFFSPYLGGKYSNARARLQTLAVPIAQDGSGKIHMENRNHLGVYLGVTVTSGEKFLFNLEGRIIDEEAVSVSGDIRF